MLREVLDALITLLNTKLNKGKDVRFKEALPVFNLFSHILKEFCEVQNQPRAALLEGYILKQVEQLSQQLEQKERMKNRLHIILVACAKHYLDWAKGLAAAALVVAADINSTGTSEMAGLVNAFIVALLGAIYEGLVQC